MGRNSNYNNDILKQLHEVMGRLDSVEKDYKTDVNKLNDKVIVLEKTIEKKDVQIKVLIDDNERLKRIVNNDSSNSSLPPSSDQKGKRSNSYNSRKKSNKKAGGQKGHQGKTLTKETIEKKIEAGEFKHVVKNIGKRKGEPIKKYVIDLHIIPVVTEYRFYPDNKGKTTIPKAFKSDVTYGSKIKAIAVDLYGEGVVSNDRIRNFINALSGDRLELSSGSIYNFCQQFAKLSKESTLQIEDSLKNALTVYTDGTNITVNGKQAYIRNMSTKDSILYSAMERKNIETLKKTGILGVYAGTLVHDHETALYHFGTKHGECNTHILRYLKKNLEESDNPWSAKMSQLLCTMNDAKKERLANQHKSFVTESLISYSHQYDAIIKNGRIENKRTKGKLTKSAEKTLLNRLEKYKENHLLFAYDFGVDFSNNMSERDLRKCKNRQKIAGGFRKNSGNEMYCSIMSVIETCKRRKMQVLENISKIFEGAPAIF